MRAALAALALAGCAAAGPAASPDDVLRTVTLRNPGFEEPPRPGETCPAGWACSMHSDPTSFRFIADTAAPASGTRSLCIERVRDEPWALATLVVKDPSLAGTRVRFSLAIRAEGLTGGAGPWVQVHGAHGAMAHEQRVVKDTRGWERLAVEIAVPRGALMVQAGATLEGPGRACLDDARLEVVKPKPPA